jgi:hypothetical protein
MPRKRTHTDLVGPKYPYICQRCREQVPWGGGRSHLQTCLALAAAQNYQCTLENHYCTDDSYRTPIAGTVTDTTNANTTADEESNLFLNDTTEDNSAQILSRNNSTQGSDIVSQNIATYLASLPGLDTDYILECINWLPRPTAITDPTRLALQFLSCTCSGDGMSKNHMKGILKFIKCLRGPDAALLPNSIETCWKQIEEVHYSTKCDIWLSTR